MARAEYTNFRCNKLPYTLYFSIVSMTRRVLGSIFHFASHFLGHGFGIIPAPGCFASSAFPVPPCESFGSLPECSRLPWEQYPLRPRVPQGNGAEMEKQIMYLNHVQLIGFLGKDPEKRQVRGNSANFTVLSIATQQSWKDSNDEWQSKTEWHRVVAFNRLGESIADTLHKGDHVLVDGQLVSSKYERENGKSKKAKAAQFNVFWSVRANSVRRLSRADVEAPGAAPNSDAAPQSGDAPF
jgi:single-strand DNA-binding protein